MFLSLSLFANQAPKGSLVIIGGALDPNNQEIYEKFIHLGGGKEKIRIAIIPAASINPTQSGQSFFRNFTRYGVPDTHIKIFPLAVKDDPSTKEINEAQWAKNGSDKKLAEEILHYNAVFFVGGDQARYRKTLMDADGNDLPLLVSIRAVFQKGGVIAGTSAGAAIMSDPMIIGGNPVEAITNGVIYQTFPSGPEPEKKVWLTRGFGFFKHGIIGQHFLKRGRTGRMIPVLLHCKKQNNHAAAFGVDEDTAIIYRDNTIEVAGSSGVLIIDTTNAKIKETPWGPKTKNITLHYLETGDSFNLETGQFHINPKREKIEKGKEYYKKYPLDTNIFGKDAVKEILTTGLMDNQQKKSEGLSFTLDEHGSGRGMRLVFRKTAKTIGYLGEIADRESFSALHVALDLFPITVRVKPLKD